MALTTKTMAAKILDTATTGDGAGEFRALVSVYGVKDHDGDIIEPGAFRKTIKEWGTKSAAGKTMPVVWSHDLMNLDSFMGKMKELTPVDHGLEVAGTLDLDHPPAARLFKLMQDGVITEFSWSGLVTEYELLEDDESSWWPGMKIKEVDLWEIGPCFRGANPETELLSIKADGRLTGGLITGKTHPGRLRAKNLAQLAAAHEMIGKILSDHEGAGQDAGASIDQQAPGAGEVSQPHEGGKISTALLELIKTVEQASGQE